MNKLTDKVALITGSDSGIGKAIAIAFAREGAKVIVSYHSDQKGGRETLKEVQALSPDSILIKLDVSSEKDTENKLDKVINDFGGLDILVNNSGVNGSGIPVDEMTTDVFDTTIKTNLYGTFFCSRKFVQHRKAVKKPGKIINISSVHEEINAPGNADYNASKAGIRNFMRTLALEVASFGINVNNIAPGMIMTPMNQKAIDDKKALKKAEKNIPWGRAGQPEEIGFLAVFLASAESDYVTGSTYAMDGGLMINIGQGA